MAYNSKYTGAQVEAKLDAVDGKQDTISDLATIRAGAAKGANAQKYANDAKAGAISDAEGKLAAAIEAEVTRSNNYADGAASSAASAAEGRLNARIDALNTPEQVDGKITEALKPYAKTENVNAELAKKANVGDSYLKSETYTQAEVQAMFDSAFAWERIEA